MGIRDFLVQKATNAVNGFHSLRKIIQPHSGAIKEFIKKVSPKAHEFITKSQPIRDLLGKGLDYGLESHSASQGRMMKPKFDISGDDLGRAANAIQPSMQAMRQLY